MTQKGVQYIRMFSSLRLFVDIEENVAIEMHCNLRATPRQSFSTLITTPTLRLSRSNYPFQTINVSVADTVRYAVTTPLTLRPRTPVVYLLWRDEILYQILARSINPRLSYGDLKIKTLRQTSTFDMDFSHRATSADK